MQVILNCFFMIFLGLVGLGGLNGEGFLVDSTRHLARRRSRVAGHGACGALMWFVLF